MYSTSSLGGGVAPVSSQEPAVITLYELVSPRPSLVEVNHDMHALYEDIRLGHVEAGGDRGTAKNGGEIQACIPNDAGYREPGQVSESDKDAPTNHRLALRMELAHLDEEIEELAQLLEKRTAEAARVRRILESSSRRSRRFLSARQLADLATEVRGVLAGLKRDVSMDFKRICGDISSWFENRVLGRGSGGGLLSKKDGSGAHRREDEPNVRYTRHRDHDSDAEMDNSSDQASSVTIIAPNRALVGPQAIVRLPGSTDVQ